MEKVQHVLSFNGRCISFIYIVIYIYIPVYIYIYHVVIFSSGDAVFQVLMSVINPFAELINWVYITRFLRGGDIDLVSDVYVLYICSNLD